MKVMESASGKPLQHKPSYTGTYERERDYSVPYRGRSRSLSPLWEKKVASRSFLQTPTFSQQTFAPPSPPPSPPPWPPLERESTDTPMAPLLPPPPYPWHLETVEPETKEESLILPGSIYETREGNKVQLVRILSPQAITLVLDLDHTLGDFDFLIPYLHMLTAMLFQFSALPPQRYPFLSSLTGAQILSWLQSNARYYMNQMGWEGADRVMKKLVPLYRAGLIKNIIVFTAGKPKPLVAPAKAAEAMNISGVEALQDWNPQRIIVEEISKHYKVPLGLSWARPSTQDSVNIPEKDFIPSLFEKLSMKSSKTSKRQDKESKRRVKDLARFSNSPLFVIDDLGSKLYRKNPEQQARVYKISPWHQPPQRRLIGKKMDKEMLPELTRTVESSITSEEAELVNQDLIQEWRRLREKYKNYLKKITKQAQRKPPKEYANSGFERYLLDDIKTQPCSKAQDCVQEGQECIHHFCQSPLGIQTPVYNPAVDLS